MSETHQTCIECDGTTHPIKVIELGHSKQQPLKYTAIDAKPSWIHGSYPIEGHLAAEMCESCGRVTFRAVPKEVAED